jgi:hypothetical protein
MTALSKPGPNTEVVKEGWFYLGTFLRGAFGDAHRPPEQRSPECSLFVTRGQIRRGPSGKVRSFVERDVLRFENDEAMLAWIEEHDAEELPQETHDNPQYVPEEFRDPPETHPRVPAHGEATR